MDRKGKPRNESRERIEKGRRENAIGRQRRQKHEKVQTKINKR